MDQTKESPLLNLKTHQKATKSLLFFQFFKKIKKCKNSQKGAPGLKKGAKKEEKRREKEKIQSSQKLHKTGFFQKKRALPGLLIHLKTIKIATFFKKTNFEKHSE
jgi:hypothetical protein